MNSNKDLNFESSNRKCNDFSDSSEDEQDDDIEDCYEDNSLQSLCLFCELCCDSPKSVFEHIEAVHGIDLVKLCVENNFDAFCYIKFINFVRENKSSVNDIENIFTNNLWRDEKYMKPVLEDDALLTFDIEEFTTDITANNCGQTEQGGITESAKVLKTQLDEMKSMIHLLLNDTSDTNNKVSSKGSDRDEYFSSYSHYSIHHEMLSDKIRTESYRDSILNNKELFRNADVLDIGCGSGILSLFAASTEAKSVVAVDNSEVIYKAMEIAHENGFSNKIEFFRTKVEEKNWGERKFDIIVSEWMGYFLVFEGMLDTVLSARDNLLRPGGVLLPNRSCLYMAGFSNMDAYAKCVTFWDNVYGFKMSTMKKDYFSEVSVEIVSPDDLCTETAIIKDLDLMKCSLQDIQCIETNFALKCTKETKVTAITVWFDCFFDSDKLKNHVILSTSPCSPVTHWKQSVLPLREPITVTDKSVIEGTISIRRLKNDVRSLSITVDIKDFHIHRYTMQ
ncbi:Protein arginine N-methyltransferase 3-like protein [Leptotrombidium deliense]|uniref:type I protein arginine methyltransferase n=1 Tax=Leptotrombidium deliense TaxID=299467 RepID=A0A443SAI1_9ACAR|nr:Protein arginine N-methyltransferase 3-like protein [Leptotrombidium deliense]